MGIQRSINKQRIKEIRIYLNRLGQLNYSHLLATFSKVTQLVADSVEVRIFNFFLM